VLPKLILWAGPKHSGKTSAVLELARAARAEGLAVAGLAAPAVREAGRLAGFDAVDLATGRREPLWRRGSGGLQQAGPFALCEPGFALGAAALGGAEARAAGLVIVDEFGPLELWGGGWRSAADRLVAGAAGVVLLVVREELVPAVLALYGRRRCRVVRPARRGAARSVLGAVRAASRPRA